MSYTNGMKNGIRANNFKLSEFKSLDTVNLGNSRVM